MVSGPVTSPPPLSLPSIEECLFGPSKIIPKTLSPKEEHAEELAHNNSTATTTTTTSATATTNTTITTASGLSSTTTTTNGGQPKRSSSSSSRQPIHGQNTGNNGNSQRRPGLGDMKGVSSNYDSLYSGHWGDAVSENHDIDISKLRRVCSQGVPDEGSYRGIAWRVLLGYLPTKNTHESWLKTIQPQRELYYELMEQYLMNQPDPGRELRGNLGKRLQQNSTLRQNYDELTRLDESYNNDDDDDDLEDNTGDNDDDDSDDDDDSERDLIDELIAGKKNIKEASKTVAEMPAEEETNGKPAELEEIKSIYERLPGQFQEQWKKLGIKLDHSNLSSSSSKSSSGGEGGGISLDSSSSTNLGINHLKVNSEHLQTQEEFDLFVKDAYLLIEIRKDVVRTHPDLFFYLEPTSNLGLRRYAAIERILFLWSKLNQGVSRLF